MKVQYSYLKFFLTTDLSQAKLVDVFTKVGFECESDGPIIDFDIMPNRGDVLSLKGLQREFSAYQSKKFKGEPRISKLTYQKNKAVVNKIDSKGCGNYHLMLIKGLCKLKKLDVKKRNFLTFSGVPLINPLVDLGNYVMFEIGAPMHIFDLEKLHLPINVLFPTKSNLPVRVIGGDIKNLQPSSLTIQDQSGIQAIAGIIGSEESSVSIETSNIAVEAAFFRPEIIVNQARKYGLATDASHRFERGVDPQIQKQALERYLFLLEEIAEFESVECFFSEVRTHQGKPVSLNTERFNVFSGLSLKPNNIILILKRLGFNLVTTKGQNLQFSVPSYRFDIALEEDLYEELLRCYGYDNIPISPPKAGPKSSKANKDILSNIRSGLVYSGFKELMHMPFVSHETYKNLDTYSYLPAELMNPINENEPLMRGSLFGSLFAAINLNIKKGYSSFKVFELGNVFKRSKQSFAQETHLSGLVYHHEPQKSWNLKEFKYDFYSLKAEVLKLLQTLGIKNIKLKKNAFSKVFNENGVDIFIGYQKIGVMGEIDLSVTEKLLKKPAYGFELYPDKVSHNFQALKLRQSSKFPLSARDINIIISKSHVYSEIESVLLRGKIKYLNSFNLINTFEGKEIPHGFISMTLRFVFQSNTKSLLESEVSESMEAALKLLEKAMKAQIRS